MRRYGIMSHLEEYGNTVISPLFLNNKEIIEFLEKYPIEQELVDTYPKCIFIVLRVKPGFKFPKEEWESAKKEEEAIIAENKEIARIKKEKNAPKNEFMLPETKDESKMLAKALQSTIKRKLKEDEKLFGKK